MPIVKRGWELHVERLGIQKKGALTRTYGTYRVYIDGDPVDDFSGHICETIGPGDNSKKNNGKRVEVGTYPLSTHFGSKYKTIGYSQDLETPGKIHMPSVLLLDTNKRTGILVHPGHPPHLYLSSVGCFNPTSPLGSADEMDFWESRERVIAIIESLKAFAPDAFRRSRQTPIPNATVVVDGEPMGAVRSNRFADVPVVASAVAAEPAPSASSRQIDLLNQALDALERSGRPVTRLHVDFLDSTSLSTINVDFHPSVSTAVVAAAIPEELNLHDKVPDQSEVSVCGAIIKKIKRGDPDFASLVSNANAAIEFKDEEGTGADRMMSSRLSDGLDRLATLVVAEWPGVKLRVTEAWDENNEHHGSSLHYEGRGADLTTSPRDGDKLGRLARLAVDAGLDWVFFEDTSHVHVSVKR